MFRNAEAVTRRYSVKKKTTQKFLNIHRKALFESPFNNMVAVGLIVYLITNCYIVYVIRSTNCVTKHFWTTVSV